MGDLIAPDVVEIIHSCMEGDSSGDVGRARFKTMRRLLKSSLVEIDAQNHFAASLVRGHFFEPLQAAIEDSKAGRPAHFVTGECEKIATNLLHIKGPVTRALRGIDQGDD